MRAAAVLAVGLACAGTPKPVEPSRTAFCRSDTPVEAIDRVLACTDETAPARYVETFVRRADGWWWRADSRDVKLTTDEHEHVETALAKSVDTICAGRGDPAWRYPSLHVEELGWPVLVCSGAYSLVLHRGGDTLVLDRPLTRELSKVFWILGALVLGRPATEG
jgi:hypothetical protein